MVIATMRRLNVEVEEVLNLFRVRLTACERVSA